MVREKQRNDKNIFIKRKRVYKISIYSIESYRNEDSYFHIIDKNNPKKILLCNGWIMQSEDSSNYYPDITSYGTWYYFKRKVIIWKDTIKINYGENISNTPEYLIKYMAKYITYLSNIFDGD